MSRKRKLQKEEFEKLRKLERSMKLDSSSLALHDPRPKPRKR
ncbi:unnamed protein product [Acanthoscelides obtectus]|uniref:Uncharacterized protein n=1 Tax=Acanthoscelides obtectus TaxID=200917 RepID=A0A9P0PW28_ACAOB|nr:unnamed protein product [Acanthoscelides obtectus]CAK1672241.1 hypothetical protein AOBTE_LOCUS28735 [Acanthoscelides obtectus]